MVKETTTMDLYHDKSEELPSHMAQVLNYDCTFQRRSPLDEVCSLIRVRTTALHFSISSICITDFGVIFPTSLQTTIHMLVQANFHMVLSSRELMTKKRFSFPSGLVPIVKVTPTSHCDSFVLYLKLMCLATM